MLLFVMAFATASRIWSAVKLLLGLSAATAASAAVLASASVCCTGAGMVRSTVTTAVLPPTVPPASVRVMAPVIFPGVLFTASTLL